MSMVLEVQGMSCGHCVSAITAAVTPLAGVTSVDVDLAGGKVTVDGSADVGAVTAAIEDSGYDVSPALSA
ncbi:heavy metal transporter [Mycobacterium sp. Root265]|uniref:cation transporter n=1 Tax=Mycobacterium sp. Root265 TaxID=1736504 RepID=UPI00070E3BCF|nr:cation transporter [Mycobacterium sp. Root265]KRD19755.1 heavy metal transporter [Mycobacterium sp. Root265]